MANPALTVGSLFSGIGGLELGLERAGMVTRWQVEIDSYCQRVLAKHWPDVPRYGDIKEVDPRELEHVDVICGGFPCQDISGAHTSSTNGARLGLSGTKSGLWAEFCRIVKSLHPQWVIVENVAQWRAWVPVVRSDLDSLGYASLPLRLPAGAFGAPHIRERIFLVANADGHGKPIGAIYEKACRMPPAPGFGRNRWDAFPGALRVDDGLPHRMDRLRALGNAVVPQVAEWVGHQIVDFDALLPHRT